MEFIRTLLEQQRKPYVVIEEDLRIVESLRARGVTALLGDAGTWHPHSWRGVDQFLIHRPLEQFAAQAQDAVRPSS